MSGKVYIIGIGPGDIDLLTVKAIKALSRADVLLLDRLTPKGITKFVKKNVEIYFIGKAPGRHVLRQEEIINLMICKAREGKIVARVHGGDAFIFGRGFEEVQALVKEGIDFEVIPGITSAIAVPEYYLLPLVHRGVASSFAVVTGREDPTKGRKFVDFKKLARAVDTIVILMGISSIKEICRELVTSGLSKDTPIAFARAFMEDSKLLITTIGKVVDGYVDFENPAVVIIGNVVNLIREIIPILKKMGKKVEII